MPPYTDEELAADIAQHKWVVLKIDAPTATEYGYSVGLTKSLGHPELVVMGLDDDTMQELINGVGEAIEAGATFKDGDVSSEFLEGYDVTFRAVPAALRASYFAWADRYYGTDDFTVLQIVYPDHERRWPWQAGVAREFVKGQPVLADVKGITSNE